MSPPSKDAELVKLPLGNLAPVAMPEGIGQDQGPVPCLAATFETAACLVSDSVSGALSTKCSLPLVTSHAPLAGRSLSRSMSDDVLPDLLASFTGAENMSYVGGYGSLALDVETPLSARTPPYGTASGARPGVVPSMRTPMYPQEGKSTAFDLAPPLPSRTIPRWATSEARPGVVPSMRTPMYPQEGKSTAFDLAPPLPSRTVPRWATSEARPSVVPSMRTPMYPQEGKRTASDLAPPLPSRTVPRWATSGGRPRRNAQPSADDFRRYLSSPGAVNAARPSAWAIPTDGGLGNGKPPSPQLTAWAMAKGKRADPTDEICGGSMGVAAPAGPSGAPNNAGSRKRARTAQDQQTPKAYTVVQVFPRGSSGESSRPVEEISEADTVGGVSVPGGTSNRALSRKRGHSLGDTSDAEADSDASDKTAYSKRARCGPTPYYVR
jgi:hypothetical protein